MDNGKGDLRKRSWEPIRLSYVGHISEIIKQGGGKLTVAGGDPGEGKKQMGVGEV